MGLRRRFRRCRVRRTKGGGLKPTLLLILVPGNVGQHCAADGCGCGSVCGFQPAPTLPIANPGFEDATGLRGPTIVDNERSDSDQGEREETPSTAPKSFAPAKGTTAKEHTETGEVWVKDRLHKNHYEVYKNRKNFEKGVRTRSVWEGGRLKQKF